MDRNILVAVGPSFSEAALSTAIERARETHSTLTIVHVIDETPWWSGSFAESLCDTRALVNQLARVIRGNCEKMLEHAGMQANWQTRSLPRDGRSVACVIADTANRCQADLVIIGARKQAWLAFGAHHVRNVVCRRTHCEVLIAKEFAKPEARVIDMCDMRDMRRAKPLELA